MRFLLIVLVSLTLVACDQDEKSKHGQKLDITSEVQKTSYSVGVKFGDNVKQLADGSLDMDAFIAGLYASYSDLPLKLTREDVESLAVAFQKVQIEKMGREREEKLAKVKEDGALFLSENAKKEGVQTLPSGLQYEVLVAGEGELAKKSDTVIVNYKGSLTGGEVFDESSEEPVTFQVDQVIPGWTEALLLMSKGSKWRLIIPSELAYGSGGAGPIPPHSVLIFEVELVDIKSA